MKLEVRHSYEVTEENRIAHSFLLLPQKTKLQMLLWLKFRIK